MAPGQRTPGSPGQGRVRSVEVVRPQDSELQGHAAVSTRRQVRSKQSCQGGVRSRQDLQRCGKCFSRQDHLFIHKTLTISSVLAL